ncbi:zinc-binding dehydrogenase [Leucobacter sp. W1038]|uniref:zinc-binding dehydrogenase n=1 Tax=Leucobacter sp. W1038 TaxID=3438281 RepID=UPI003D96CE3C
MQGSIAALVGPSQIEVKHFDVPTPAPDAVVLKIRRANVCGSDIHQFHYHSAALREAALGHEFVAEISALGSEITKDNAGQPVAVGDRVAPVYYITCRKCARCLRGEFGMCQNSLREWAKNPELAPHFTGAFATHYYLHPDQYFFKVPDGLSDAVVAGANCGLSQMIFALDKTRLSAGSTLLIQGAGGLGLYAAAVAKERGVRVLVVEGVDERIELARNFGADEIVDMREHATVEARVARVLELTNGDGPDVVLEVTGVAAAFPESVELARVGGEIVSVGNLNVGEGFQVTLSPGLITRKNLTIHGVLRYDPWYLQKALAFLLRTQDRYPFESLTERTYPFEDLTTAISDSEARKVTRASIIFN